MKKLLPYALTLTMLSPAIDALPQSTPAEKTRTVEEQYDFLDQQGENTFPIMESFEESELLNKWQQKALDTYPEYFSESSAINFMLFKDQKLVIDSLVINDIQSKKDFQNLPYLMSAVQSHALLATDYLTQFNDYKEMLVVYDSLQKEYEKLPLRTEVDSLLTTDENLEALDKELSAKEKMWVSKSEFLDDIIKKCADMQPTYQLLRQSSDLLEESLKGYGKTYE